MVEVRVSIPFRLTRNVVFDSDIGGGYLDEGHKDGTNMEYIDMVVLGERLGLSHTVSPPRFSK